ncbi:MAG: CDP-diacylglycerol--glycerol-3-phosphate 3-phosphatidyltransferase [Nitrospirota bacterium]
MSTLRLNLPIVITLSRIVLIPVFIFTVYVHPLFGAFIFILASLTDFLDGYLARRSGEITKFGIILDPIADKFLVISALIVLVDMARLPAWIAIVIVAREFLVTGLRVVALSKDIVIPAELGGKLKTTTQIISIICLIIARSIHPVDLYDVGLVLIWIALALSIISGVQYTASFWKKYEEKYVIK